jgi:dipeptidyl aminopeptidase/acylaminoacyl peptidase
MRILFSTALAAALALPALAQTAPAAKRPMTFDDLQAMKRVSDPQVSPSGKWVMFSVMDVDLALNSKINHLWAVPTDGSSKEFQLTAGVGESSGRFSPDGTRFVFVTKGQLYLSAWNDKNGTMSPAVELTHIATEADGPLWSPDGQSIAFVSEVHAECSAEGIYDDACNQKADDEAAHAPTKAMIFDRLLYRHWNTFQGEKRSHILMLHVASASRIFDLTPAADWGNFIVAPTFALGGSLGYAWAPDSKEFAFVLNDDKVPAASTNNDIYTIDPTLHDGETASGKGWSPKKISTSPGSDDAPAYSPDGKYLAFRSQARAGYESDRFRLMLYDRKSKKTREFRQKLHRPVGADFDGWIDEFVWVPDSAALVFTSAIDGEEAVFSHGLVDGDDGTKTLFVIRAGTGEYGDIHVSTTEGGGSQKSTLFATKMTASSPTDVISLDLGMPGHEFLNMSYFGGEEPSIEGMPGEEERQLTHINGSLVSMLDLPEMESFWFPGANATKVQGFLIRPPNFNPSKKYPLKFLIHGGPQGAWGDAWSYRWNAELFAASGYVVVMINPRGSTGYGQAFIDGVNGDWGGKPYIDLMRGLDYAEAHYPFIDKTRECALGASYGGYMANWILTHTNRFACIVTHDGMFNPQSAYGTTDELWFNEWEFRRPGTTEPGQPWRYAAGPIADDPFRKWSPMLSIQNAKTPTLVIHSQRDYRLDVSEGFQLFTALQRLNVPSKMLYFPDEGHWIQKPQNSKLWYATVNDWCDQWTHTNKYTKPN